MTDLSIGGEEDEQGQQVAQNACGHHQDGCGQADAQRLAITRSPCAFATSVAAHGGQVRFHVLHCPVEVMQRVCGRQVVTHGPVSCHANGIWGRDYVTNVS